MNDDNYTSKYKEAKDLNKDNKETNTLDNKHRLIVKGFNNEKKNMNSIESEIKEIDNEIIILDKNRSNFSFDDITKRAGLLDKLYSLKERHENIVNNYNEMDYYDNTGDLILNYYDLRDNKETETKEIKNILSFLCNNQKSNNIENNDKNNNNNNRALLFEKYCQRIDGVRPIKSEQSNRIKYCSDCKIEKILDLGESTYVCSLCGDSEMIILDEDVIIKDYSPYKRLNHFREWLNQFQAKQTPDIPDQVFIDIMKELNKNRITDLSTLNKKNMKIILKKIKYNIYYEHVSYIINKLNNLPPPKITRDMEKVFICMFIKIQEPWELYKHADRKNFLSYSYVLHKFCELLELDHLLEYFSLHKVPEKIMENDNIWEKICKVLQWEYISSFK
jgi:hypothetical protein